jgi:itaconyl-CoA hydratase/mesaconyl-C4 CoA hydratase
MSNVDFSSWIGRQETTPGRIDTDHARKIALTLAAPVPEAGQLLPRLWQWAFFQDSMPTPELGIDGHPKTGGFLPPMPGLNRMWAGGRVDFFKPLIVGADARRVSTVKAVKEKEGRGGKLLFVTVQHEYVQDGEAAIREEQDLVYRAPAPPKLTGTEPAPTSQWKTQVEPRATLLFRYSAVTFNTHRIHYDFPYATQEEGYPGIVVHGPLLATLMLQGFERANPDRNVTHFAYRGLRPLIAPAPFHVAGAIQAPGQAQVWAEQDGALAHQATVHFE